MALPFMHQSSNKNKRKQDAANFITKLPDPMKMSGQNVLEIYKNLLLYHKVAKKYGNLMHCPCSASIHFDDHCPKCQDYETTQFVMDAWMEANTKTIDEGEMAEMLPALI